MRVLWICSFAPTLVAKHINGNENYYGGWIDGALKTLKTKDDISIGICFAQSKSADIISGSFDNIEYYGIYIDNLLKYDAELKNKFTKVINLFKPDILQIYGVEYPAFLAATESVSDIPTISYIQGLCGAYSDHYFASLPYKSVTKASFRDIVRRDSLVRQKYKFQIRGIYENKIIEKSDYIIGRTRFDKAYVNTIKRGIKYYCCNESLRPVFYENANMWNYSDCRKHSIFVSQAWYPIKGFHLTIEALNIISKAYSDAMLYTTGVNPFEVKCYRRSGYQQYICKLIKKYNLKDKVIFLGKLSPSKMCEQYLNSNVFVSSSSIENSPNSVGEAMLLGMPVIASYVGGTMDLLVDKEEGYLYQYDAVYMLAYYISKVFDDKENIKSIGSNAYKHASITHDVEKNANDLLRIYREIVKN